MREDLLQPVLSENSAAMPAYSVRALFFVAFLGGPLAATLFAAANSYRMSRLGRDMPVYALLAIITLGLPSMQLLDPAIFSVGDAPADTRTFRYLVRAMGLLFVGIIYLLHKKHYRVAETFGHTYESPWLPGVACTVISLVISVGVTLAWQRLVMRSPT